MSSNSQFASLIILRGGGTVFITQYGKNANIPPYVHTPHLSLITIKYSMFPRNRALPTFSIQTIPSFVLFSYGNIFFSSVPFNSPYSCARFMGRDTHTRNPSWAAFVSAKTTIARLKSKGCSNVEDLAPPKKDSTWQRNKFLGVGKPVKPASRKHAKPQTEPFERQSRLTIASWWGEKTLAVTS